MTNNQTNAVLKKWPETSYWFAAKKKIARFYLRIFSYLKGANNFKIQFEELTYPKQNE